MRGLYGRSSRWEDSGNGEKKEPPIVENPKWQGQARKEDGTGSERKGVSKKQASNARIETVVEFQMLKM